MRVHVLHHGHCFDGMVSACVFAAFLRQHCPQPVTPVFIPKHYGNGDPFDESDFAGDINACVDFRYTRHPRLHWYFDHHRSAFQSAEDRGHFVADGERRKFHDADAPSCARLIAQIARDQFDVDLSPFNQLIEWADTIDRARFPSPAAAVTLENPAMRLAAFVQVCDDQPAAQSLIDRLTRDGLEATALAPDVAAVVEARQREREINLALLDRRARIRGEVLTYDLLGDGPRVLNHFLPYYLHPTVRYAVGTYEGSDGSLRLSVGFNPWLDPSTREHDLAALCEAHGGGGHAYVGGCTLSAGEKDRMRTIWASVSRVLRRAPAASSL
ncbi:MAG: phosphoesterase [Myxococcales bacterium FL481]|nr:MAG: phosphoesterase [Myxococcales bacterium FL481]